MKKFKTLLLGTVMVCSFAMLTACGKTPEVTEDDVMDGLEEEGIITEEMDEDSYSVEIGETDLNDEEDKATVEVTLTRTEGYMKYTTDYELKFKLNADKDGWKYRDGKYEKGETKEELAKGITDEDAKNKLDSSWNSVYVEDADKSFYFGSDIKEYNITDAETDLEEKKSVVTFEATVESGYCTYNIVYDVTFGYDYGWSIKEIETTDCETEYIDGYEDEIDADTVISDLKGATADIYCMGQYIRFSETEEFTLDVKDSRREDYYTYIDGEFSLKYKGEVVKGTITVEYHFNDDDKEWQLYDIDDYEVTSYDTVLAGTWTGTHTENGATYTVVIDGTDYLENGSMKAKVTIVASAGTFEYDATAYYYPEYQEYSINHETWVTEPENSWEYDTSFYGKIEDGKLVESWGDATFTKSE